MKQYELTTLNHFPKANWLVGRCEEMRFRDIVLAWKVKNKTADQYREMIFEDLVTNHLLCQRLKDRTRFFDGSPTDYRNVKEDRSTDISTEDAARKAREWKENYPMLMQTKIQLFKLALASKIEITGDVSASSFFGAFDERERKALDKYRDNGSDRNKKETADLLR